MRGKRRLFKLCYKGGLTLWDYLAAQTLLQVNGMENAVKFLETLSQRKAAKQQPRLGL